MDAAERDRRWEVQLLKALWSEKVDLQSELETADPPLRFCLRLQIQACEMLLEQLERRRVPQPSTRAQAHGRTRPAPR
jgi:hypothetical protein